MLMWFFTTTPHLFEEVPVKVVNHGSGTYPCIHKVLIGGAIQDSLCDITNE